MSSVTIARTFAVGAVTVAVALVLWTRGRDADAPLLAPAAQPASLPIATRSPDGPLADVRDTPAAAKLRELEAMSETFRNTTFLIAIRDSGYVCRDLLGVYGGVNDSATWTASCSELLAYTVRIASEGNLHVEPMLEHSDSLVPIVEQTLDAPAPPLPPQRVVPRQPR